MATTKCTNFRFKDLPLEIRNMIYRELLCDFSTELPDFEFGMTPMFSPAPHAIDTAILRTNKSISREASDVMLKTNLFVRVTNEAGLPAINLFYDRHIPVISTNKQIVKGFPGYVLAIYMRNKDAQRAFAGPEHREILAARDVMIRHRDLDVFCQTMAMVDGCFRDFSRGFAMTITIAPTLFQNKDEQDIAPLRDFFSETTQNRLLDPFLKHLRGLKDVTVDGHVEPRLAASFQRNIARSRELDPEIVLSELATKKAAGLQSFQKNNKGKACIEWQTAILGVDKVLQSSSWPAVVKQGGISFLSKMAELYLVTNLNIAQSVFDLSKAEAHVANEAGIMTDRALESAFASLEKDFWAPGHRYRPRPQHATKLLYRSAVHLRLSYTGQPFRPEALAYIDSALAIQPHDTVILAERERIRAWAAGT